MPEETTETAETATEAQSAEKPKAFSQEQVNSLLADERRKHDARYADYGDMKKKAEAHDKALEAARTDQEKAVEAAKAEGRTEALTAANTRLVSAEARALAAEAKFRNPALAVRAVDLSSVKVADDGAVDAEAIKAALKELSESEPYLIEDGKTVRPKPDESQGNRPGATSSSVSRGRDMYAKKTS